MARILVVALTCLIMGVMSSSSPSVAEADEPVNEAWVARYSGSANIQAMAYDVAVDSWGNVYVTGSSTGIRATHQDYATVKYDSAGNQLWVAIYNGPHSGTDEAYAMVLDVSGNIYITGYSENDYATVKYDGNGNQLWVARYDAVGTWPEAEAWNIAVDKQGNVYVTSSSTGDYVTIKYDTDGNQLWVARYNGPTNGQDETSDIAIDSEGNVYVTGSSDGLNTKSDYATIKYDTNGNQLWITRYNSPVNESDRAIAISLDKSGSVYVTGTSMDSDYSQDFTTIKYDKNGNQLWIARYSGSEISGDGASDMALDESGNIYVTGHNVADCATVKYDTNGKELWVARYNGPGNGAEYPYDMELDSQGNVYITGSSNIGSGMGQAYATLKYDSAGNQLWVARYSGPATKPDDAAHALAIDTKGNVYVTGYSLRDDSGGTVPWEYTTIKYTQTVESTSPTPPMTSPKSWPGFHPGVIGGLSGLVIVGVSLAYLWRRKHQQTLLINRYKQKLTQWEKDGYDVSNFKGRWFE
jgi:uncharacterized delta-60 repeat protein